MRLNSLYIERYKNLQDFNIDFNSESGLSILVGNNGSGKSNLLEVISGIFHDLFKEKKSRKITCDYVLVYDLNEVECRLEQKNGRLQCFAPGRIKKEKFIAECAPNSIIGLYSGEEDRLWTQFYQPYYNAYIRRIKSNQYQDRMRLMLIDKRYWNIALLTLLLSSNDTLEPFIKEELRITSVEKITLHFNLRHYQNSNQLLKAFIDRINPEHVAYKVYTRNELNRSVFYDTLTDENGNILEDTNGDALLVDSGLSDLEVFRCFTQAFIPPKERIIDSIVISINDGITVQQLSEGEKKLILVQTVLEILADEKSLVLMDEPDAHLHESRKKTLYSIMAGYYNRMIVIASHSPTFIDVADKEEIIMLKTDDNGYALLYEAEKLEAIRDLTGSRTNAFLEKPILYCEGAETSAESSLYPVLFPEYKIIPAGGHEEVIHLTKTYNRTFGDATHYAIGIIDWDYKTDAQLSALKEEKIYSLKVVEIENVLMDIVLLDAAKNAFCSEENSIEIVKEVLFEDCRRRKEYQATKFTANSIVSQIKAGISPEGKTIDKVKERVLEYCDIAKIDILYNQRLQCLDDYLKDSRFDELVKIYDFGHNINRFLKAIVDNYQDRLLRLIQKSKDLQRFIKTTYYPDIV